MFNLIPQIILFLAVGVIVALIAKNISKVKKFSNQTEEIPAALKIPRENEFLKKIPLEKLNDKFNRLLEKFIRKVRIIMMRTDTRLQRRLESLKDSNKPKTLFKVEEKIEENVPGIIAETEVLIVDGELEEDLSVIKADEFEVVNGNANLEKIDKLVIASNSATEADIKPVKKRRKKKEENN